MSLTRKQMQEIVEFDRTRRAARDYDGRPYGSVTGWNVPRETMRGARPTRKTLRYNYIVPGRARGKARPDVTVVHVAVRLNGAWQPVVKDVGRWIIKTGRLELRDIDYHGLGGWIVTWDRSDWAGKRDEGRLADYAGTPCDRGWWSGGKWKFNTGLTFPWHETVNPEALKGTKYEWCQFGSGARCRAGLVDWLMMYSQEPKIELLAKAGLHALICPAGLKALKDRRVRDWCLAHREEIVRKDGPIVSAKDVLWAARHGVTVAAAERRRAFAESVRHHIGCSKVPRIDYDRLWRAFARWKIGAAEYARYLEHALECGLDLRNEGTMYPPTRGGRAAFMERLERLERRAARKRREEARKAREAREAEERWIRDTMKTRIKELEAFQDSMKRSDILKGSGYTLVVAKTQKELLAEGRRMGNCIGSGYYGRGIVEGGKLIVLLRRRGKSYCDIEIDRTSWTVRQCYLKGNRPAPEETHALAKRIAAWFKAEHARHMKRGTFKELKRKAA